MACVYVCVCMHAWVWITLLVCLEILTDSKYLKIANFAISHTNWFNLQLFFRHFDARSSGLKRTETKVFRHTLYVDSSHSVASKDLRYDKDFSVWAFLRKCPCHKFLSKLIGPPWPPKAKFSRIFSACWPKSVRKHRVSMYRCVKTKNYWPCNPPWHTLTHAIMTPAKIVKFRANATLHSTLKPMKDRNWLPARESARIITKAKKQRIKTYGHFFAKSFPKKCLFEPSIFRLFGCLPIYHACVTFTHTWKSQYFSDFLISHNVRKSHFSQKQNRSMINRGAEKQRIYSRKRETRGCKIIFGGKCEKLHQNDVSTIDYDIGHAKNRARVFGFQFLADSLENKRHQNTVLYCSWQKFQFF